MAHLFEMQDNGILHITVSGDFNEDDLDDYLTQLRSYIDPLAEDDRLLSFLDASTVGHVSPQVRRAVGDFVKDPRFGNTAVYGTNRFVKVLIDFVLRASGRDHVRYFTNRDEALIWLENNNSR
ncbi:MAG: STAS/SEC14 domain-containing protein [Chloroflexi bacterium]|nr:STAS/SEC14 domain-containing protein [Chloroflexota bacterium]MBP7044888.1 STAS/SEC14 domain-containing protein [Chloroflexota bacterium]